MMRFRDTNACSRLTLSFPNYATASACSIENSACGIKPSLNSVNNSPTTRKMNRAQHV